MPRNMLLPALLVGVAWLGVAAVDSQSEPTIEDSQPISASLESDAGKSKMETPEVVLSLKYDKGELNRIYLAQFRKIDKPLAPSVTARLEVCADLCHAGLGGDGCGSSCQELMPVGIKNALREANVTGEEYGLPRTSVCPTLCQNRLGDPLCSCREPSSSMVVDWRGVCLAFCEADGYQISGCPACESVPTSSPALMLSRALSNTEGWTAWCNVQCRQGQGGAACNCDRAPFQ